MDPPCRELAQILPTTPTLTGHLGMDQRHDTMHQNGRRIRAVGTLAIVSAAEIATSPQQYLRHERLPWLMQTARMNHASVVRAPSGIAAHDQATMSVIVKRMTDGRKAPVAITRETTESTNQKEKAKNEAMTGVTRIPSKHGGWRSKQTNNSVLQKPSTGRLTNRWLMDSRTKSMKLHGASNSKTTLPHHRKDGEALKAENTRPGNRRKSV